MNFKWHISEENVAAEGTFSTLIWSSVWQHHACHSLAFLKQNPAHCASWQRDCLPNSCLGLTLALSNYAVCFMLEVLFWTVLCIECMNCVIKFSTCEVSVLYVCTFLTPLSLFVIIISYRKRKVSPIVLYCDHLFQTDCHEAWKIWLYKRTENEWRIKMNVI